jgi:hypothetical protein
LSRRRAGAASVVVLVALTGLIAFTSLGIDAGLVWAARNQLQNAADAGALGAAGNLLSSDFRTVQETQAQAAALLLTSQHSAIHAASVADDASEMGFEIGQWDFAARSFTPRPGETDASRVDAVRVTTHLDSMANGPLPTVMARILGRESFDVSAAAVAYVGYVGQVPPGSVDLPIAMHCCKLQGPGCGGNYCSQIETAPPNVCELPDLASLVKGEGDRQDVDDPSHPHYAPSSCIELHSDPEQTACWTNFRPGGSINTKSMLRLVSDGNGAQLGVDDMIALDNGVKTPVIAAIATEFLDHGKDRYPPYDGEKDSWVVRLPVIGCPGGSAECQHPAPVTDFVCFEIRQVDVNSGHEIRGRFLCNSDDPNSFVNVYDVFEDCGIGGSESGGNPDFGIRSEIPVLVN